MVDREGGGDDRHFPHQSKRVRCVCQSLSDDGCVSEHDGKRKRQTCPLYLSCDGFSPEMLPVVSSSVIWARVCGLRQPGYKQRTSCSTCSPISVCGGHTRPAALCCLNSISVTVYPPPSLLYPSHLWCQRRTLFFSSTWQHSGCAPPTHNPSTCSTGWPVCSLAWPWQDLCLRHVLQAVAKVSQFNRTSVKSWWFEFHRTGDVLEAHCQKWYL